MAGSLSNVRSELFKLFNGKLQKGKINNTTKRKVKKQTSKSTFRRPVPQMESTDFHQAHYKYKKTFFTKDPVCHILKEACQFFPPVQ